MTIAANIAICHRNACGKRGSPSHGLLPCLVNGEDVHFNAKHGCPLSYFAASDDEPDIGDAPHVGVAVARLPPSDWLTRGPALWSELHRSALLGQLTEQYIVDFTAAIGCGDCRAHWIAWTRANPPDMSSAEAQFAWTVQAHNSVNQRINKPQLTVQQALSIWQPSA